MSLTLDVFPNILDHIHSTSDLFNLCLSSRSIAYYSRSRLYDGTLFSATVSGVRPNDRRRVSDRPLPACEVAAKLIRQV